MNRLFGKKEAETIINQETSSSIQRTKHNISNQDNNDNDINNPVSLDETLDNEIYTKDDNVELIAEMWEKTVETADSVTDKRISASNFYMTIDTALIGLLYFVSNWWDYTVAAVGLIIAVLWFFSVQNYRYLSSAKWKVVNDLEKKLPVKPFTYEWKVLTHRKHYRYFQVTKIERIMPLLFGLLFLLIIILKICGVSIR